MKTKKLFIVAALGLMTCSCEDPDLGLEDVKYTVVAELDPAVATRTTLVPEDGEDTGNEVVNNLLWAEGDKINVVTVNAANSTACYELTLAKGTGTNLGTFDGKIPGGTTPYLLLYPSAVKLGATERTIVLPSVYGDADTDYSPNTNAIMAADPAYPGEDGSVLFEHLGGILAVSMTDIPANAKGVVLTTNRGITGTFPLGDEYEVYSTLLAQEATVEGEEEDNTTISILFKPENEPRDEVFYFPLPVGQYNVSLGYINEENAGVLVHDVQNVQITSKNVVTIPTIVVGREPAATITYSDVTSTDAHIKITPAGGPIIYYIQNLDMDVADMTEEERGQKIAAQIKSTTSSGSSLSAEYDGSFLRLYREFYMPNATFAAGCTYFVGVAPKPANEGDKILEADVTYVLITLDGYGIDNESTASVTFGAPTETISNVSVKITPATGTHFRYKYMDYETYTAEYEGKGDKGLMDFAMEGGEKKFYTTCSVSPCVPGKDYMVVVYAYDPSTAKGKVFTQKLSCPAIVYNEAIKLELDVLYTGANYAKMEIKPVGGDIASIRYGFMKKADYENNATLKGALANAEIELVKKMTVSNRREINTDNLASDYVYMIENLYVNEPEQQIFVIAYDADGKIVHLAHTVIDTKKPFDDGFDVNLPTPTVNDVYYYITNTGGAGYNVAKENWLKMSELTDVTSLDSKNGTYWLDLDWGGEANKPKRMWLCGINHNDWKDEYALGTDMKANAIAVLKKRAGNPTAVAPDFYGRNTTTGALTLTGVTMWNISEVKALRDKTVSPIGPKTLHLVWETADGKYGYMAVVPEEFVKESSGGDTDTPGQETPATPWGKKWIHVDNATQAYTLYDLGSSDPNKINICSMVVADDDGRMVFEVDNSYDTTGMKTNTSLGYFSWEDMMENEYRLYWSSLDLEEGMVVIKSLEGATYEGIGIPENTVLMDASDYPVIIQPKQ